VLLCGLGLNLALTAPPAQAAPATYGYSGGEQAFVAPGGVSNIHVLAVAGSGGEGGLFGGGARAARATGGNSVLTRKSLKCMGSEWTRLSFARCRPQLTLAAVQTFATTAAPEFMPRSFTTTTDLGGGRISTEAFQADFVSVSACHRSFPRPYESGCSLITRNSTTSSEPGNVSTYGSCAIESLVALGAEVVPPKGVHGSPGDSALFHIKNPEPFAVVVSAVGPNPDPPPPVPC
jgi:hypothetical protein